MRGEQAIFNLEIKKKSGLSINPDIHHSKVFRFQVSGFRFQVKQCLMSIKDSNLKLGNCCLSPHFFFYSVFFIFCNHTMITSKL